MACPRPTFFSLSARCPADSADDMETILGCHRRACSNASSTFAPAARVATEKRSGNDSTIFSVLFPMDPVDPSMAMFLMGGCIYGIAWGFNLKDTIDELAERDRDLKRGEIPV